MTVSRHDAALGYTLVEMILVVALLGIFAMIAIPRFDTSMLKAGAAATAARELVCDLRLCRTLAIANASTNSQGFSLLMKTSSPYTSYELVDLSSSATISTKSIPAAVSCTGDPEFRFGPLGNLTVGGGAGLTLAAAGKTSLVVLTPATGRATCQDG